MAGDDIDALVRIRAVDDSAPIWQGVADKIRQASSSAGQAIQAGITRPMEQSSAAMEKMSRTAEEKVGRGVKHSFREAGDSVAEYLNKFLAVGAIEEFTRRSVLSFATVERGMTQLQIATGATRDQLRQLGDQFDDMAKRTGKSVESLQGDFNKFLSGSGLNVDQASQVFDSITKAAEVSGASVEDVSRSVAAAINNLKVPISEIPELLGNWVTTIPPAMMGAFSTAAPRIMQTLQNLGFTGQQAGKDIAAVFKQMEAALGNPRLAASAIQEIFSKMMDISSPLGQRMLPTLRDIQAAGGSSADALKKMVDMVAELGGFSEDPMQRAVVQRMLSIDPNTLRALQVVHEHLGEINADLAKGSSLEDAFSKVDKDPLAAINRLIGGISQLGTAFAKLLDQLGTTRLLTEVADAFNTISKSVEGLDDLISGHHGFDWDEYFGMTGLKLTWENFKLYWETIGKEIKNFATTGSFMSPETKELERRFKIGSAYIQSLGGQAAQGRASALLPPPGQEGTEFSQRFGTWGGSGLRRGGAGGGGGGPGTEQQGGAGNAAAISPMRAGEMLPSGMYAPITTNQAGGGLGSASASRGAGGHQGDDYMAAHGSPVVSPKDGVVEHYGQDNFGGMTMRVRHSDGTSSSYLHLSRRDVPVGTPVKGGQTIGLSGTANGVPHLHMEMRNAEGQLISPRQTLGITRGQQAPPAAGPAGEGTTTRGSWFGNFQGQHSWNDPMSGPRTASGQPLSVPGIALPSRSTLGQMFTVTGPDGRQVTVPQTDVGPARWTGKGVDVNSAAAEKMGYTPQNFPTGGQFHVAPHQPAAPPAPGQAAPAHPYAPTHDPLQHPMQRRFDEDFGAFHSMREEMQKPIKLSIDSPTVAPMMSGRQRVARQHARWSNDDLMGNDRYNSMSDIGFA